MPDGTPYQISCTAYDAVGRDDRRYLLARALQLFVPGIPQVYYVGLLAGRNAPSSRRRPRDQPPVVHQDDAAAACGGRWCGGWPG